MTFNIEILANKYRRVILRIFKLASVENVSSDEVINWYKFETIILVSSGATMTFNIEKKREKMQILTNNITGYRRVHDALFW